MPNRDSHTSETKAEKDLLTVTAAFAAIAGGQDPTTETRNTKSNPCVAYNKAKPNTKPNPALFYATHACA